MKTSIFLVPIISWIPFLCPFEFWLSQSDAMTIKSSSSIQELDGDNTEDPRVVAKQFLESWKDKDARGMLLAAGEVIGDKLPESYLPGGRRYKSCFGSTSWRWQVVVSWPGEFDEVRIRTDGENLQEAYVKFDELTGRETSIIVVALRRSDGKWIAEDILSPPREDYEAFGELVYKANPPAKNASRVFDEMDFHKTTFDLELLEKLFATVREDKWDIYIERMQWVVFDLPGGSYQQIEPTPSVIAALGEAMGSEDNRPLQRNAERVLAKIGVAAFPTIRNALFEGNVAQKHSAMRVLRELSWATLYSNWELEFDDPSHQRAVRHSVRSVLGNYAMVDLVPLLADDDVEIRRAAVMSLGQIGSKLSMQPFSQHANYYVGNELLPLVEDDQISSEVCWAIGQLIPKKTKSIGFVGPAAWHFTLLKELIERFPRLSVDAQAEVIRALEPGLGDQDLGEQVTNLLIDSLKHENQALRRDAAWILSTSTSFRPRVIRELEKALSVEKIHKGAMAAALFQLSRETENAGQALDALTGLFEEKLFRNLAAKALARMSDSLSIEARQDVASKLLEAYQADNSFVVARRMVKSIAPELLASRQNACGLPLCISPNNQLVAVYGGANDQLVRILNVDDGKIYFETQTKIGMPGNFFQTPFAAFSPSGKFFAASTQDNSIYIWDVQNKSKVAELRGHTDIVYLLAFSSDEKSLVSTAGDETTRLWDLESFTELRKLEPKLGGELKLTEKEITYGRSQLLDLDFTQDGTITTVSANGSVFIWESQTGQVIQKFQTTALANACISPDGTCVAIQSKNSQNILVLDLASGYFTNVISLEYEAQPTSLHSVTSLAFLPGNKTLFAAGKFGSDQFIAIARPVNDFGSHYRLPNFKLGFSFRSPTVISSTDGSLFLRGTADEELHIWKTRDFDD